MKYIDYFTGLKIKMCPFCERRVIHEEMGVTGRTRLFICLKPHTYGDDETKMLIDEPCNMNDYSHCPMAQAK